jgi:hypothetical protein
MNDRRVIAVGFSLIVIVLLTAIAYVVFVGTVGLGEIAILVVMAILVAFAAYVMWDKARSALRKMPAEDERVRNVNYRAGYYGFIAAIMSAVIAPALSDILFDHELEGHLVTAVVVIVSGLVFAASYLYLSRKGN